MSSNANNANDDANESIDFIVGEPAAIAALPASLRDMAVWAEENPPMQGWMAATNWNVDPNGLKKNLREQPLVYLHPGVRFQITAEQACDIAYGLGREDDLGALGVFGSELDSQAFAQNLFEAVGDHLSIRNLKHLVDVFSKALVETEAARQSNQLVRQKYSQEENQESIREKAQTGFGEKINNEIGGNASAGQI